MTLTLINTVQSTYNWTRDLIYSFIGRPGSKALIKEVEELKTQLQRAMEYGALQEQRILQLSENLELETNENCTLWDQIVALNSNLHQVKQHREMNRGLLLREEHKSQALSQKLEVMQSQLDEQTKKMVDAERMINNLTASYNKSYNQLDTAYKEICESHKIQEQQLAAQKKLDESLVLKLRETERELQELTASHSNLQQRYDTDIKAEKQMNATLQKKVEMHLHSHARTVSEHKKQVNDMILQQNAFCQKLEDYKLMKQSFYLNLRSIYVDLKSSYIDLKIQFHDQTLKNTELAAKLKAEEEANRVLRTKNVRLLHQMCQQEEVSSAVSLDPELVEEESLCVLQDQEPEEQEFVSVVQDQEPEESVSVLQDTEPEEQEFVSVVQDREPEESVSVVQDREPEESVSVLQDTEPEEQEFVSVVQDREPEEFVSVLQDTEPEEQESVSVLQDQEPEEQESLCVLQDTEPEEEECDGVLLDSEPEEQETVSVLQDQEPEEEESDGVLQDTEPEEEESDGVLLDSEPEEEESDGVLQDTEPEEEESDGVLLDTEPEEEESDGVLQDTEPEEEESDGVLQDSEPEEEESDGVLQDSEPEEEESDGVLQDQNLWQLSSALSMIKNAWRGPSALPMIPNIWRRSLMLYGSYNV
ncbi:bromodomain-containing protein DDB_G0280777-like isoform X1 [Acanthopagrus latus]|uniref:bromodomain-containing protein DDB_G0280777-like isoform X1 n=1 Tax=Acanthopagrus latus TaxID=8177 RepID=UPI00187C64F7|nr:bromodomain-containing protein DDB_G0280777-like isoform X1 [Acanthopagrus latus]